MYKIYVFALGKGSKFFLKIMENSIKGPDPPIMENNEVIILWN